MSMRPQSSLIILSLVLVFLTAGESSAYEPLITIGKPDLQDILYSPDGRFLVTLTASYLEFLDAKTFVPVTSEELDGDTCKLAFSPDSSLLAILGR